MLKRTFVLTALAVGVATLVTLSPTHAAAPLTRINKLTFNAPVALPGVVLVPGTYAFESGPSGTDPSVVRVTSANYQKVFFTGLTQLISRPSSMPASQVLSLGEARMGAPAPITAWYPLGVSTGHQFVYR